MKTQHHDELHHSGGVHATKLTPELEAYREANAIRRMQQSAIATLMHFDLGSAMLSAVTLTRHEGAYKPYKLRITDDMGETENRAFRSRERAVGAFWVLSRRLADPPPWDEVEDRLTLAK